VSQNVFKVLESAPFDNGKAFGLGECQLDCTDHGPNRVEADNGKSGQNQTPAEYIRLKLFQIVLVRAESRGYCFGFC
jgi:hypothetical protein